MDIHQLILHIGKFSSEYTRLKNEILAKNGISKTTKPTVSRPAIAKLGIRTVKIPNASRPNATFQKTISSSVTSPSAKFTDAKLSKDPEPEIIKLTQFLKDLEKKLSQAVLQRRDYLNLYIKIETEIMALEKKISSLNLEIDFMEKGFMEKGLLKKPRFETTQLEITLHEKLLRSYLTLQRSFIDIFDTFNTADIVKKVNSLYKIKYSELEKNRDKNTLIWESLLEILHALFIEAQAQQEKEHGLFNSIKKEASIQKKPLTAMDISTLTKLEKYLHSLKTLQNRSLEKFAEKVILSNIRRVMRTEQLCKDYKVNFLSYFNNKSSVEDNLIPACTGAVFDWGKRVHEDRQYSLEKNQSSFLKAVSPLFEILRADKLPPDLMIDMFYQGDKLISPDVLWCRNQLPKFMSISGNVSIIKEATKDNPLRCEGREVALDSIQLLNKAPALPMSLPLASPPTLPVAPALASSPGLPKPPAASSFSTSIQLVEITLNTVNTKYIPHTIGMAKVSSPVTSARGVINPRERYYLINSEIGEFSCDCPKLFAEWMQQHFKMLYYNNYYCEYSVRNIDKAIEILLEPSSTRVAQEKTLARKSEFILSNYRSHTDKASSAKLKFTPKLPHRQAENTPGAKKIGI